MSKKVFFTVIIIGIVFFSFLYVEVVEDNKVALEEQKIKEEKYKKIRIEEERKEAYKRSQQNTQNTKSSSKPIILTSYEPKVGMTAREVYDSSWAYPNDVVKTTTSSGTTEMWIYPEGNYIHFKDGRVSSVKASSY